MSDEIIKELWAIKDQSAKDAAYNVDELCRRLNERDRKTTALVVDLSLKDRQVVADPN